MERKIGEIFEVCGEWYQCVEGNCAYCSIQDEACGQRIINDVCRLNRIFKKLEKVGEPFSCDYYGNGKLVMMQEYQLYEANAIYNYSNPPMYINDYNRKRIAIEIKQKKENNMEEKKLNLKPFDIQKAREGKPVCTRDGRSVRIICFNRESIGFPIIALVKNGDTEGVYQFDDKGRSNIDDEERGYDLMMLPEKKEGWVNIYALNTCYSSKEEAEANIDKDYEHEYVRTVKINWEE